MDCAQQCNCSVQNSVECVRDNGTCVCKAGWRGADCAEDVDECAGTDPCVDNAQCHNTLGSYVCVCRKGFFTTAGGNCTGKQSIPTALRY